MSANLLLSALALDFGRNPLPEILYHYTSADALLSIVNSGRISATNIDYLNDSSEVAWMWKAVASQLEATKLSENKAESECATQILKKIKSDDGLERVRSIVLRERRRLESMAGILPRRIRIQHWICLCGTQYPMDLGSIRRRTRICRRWAEENSVPRGRGRN